MMRFLALGFCLLLAAAATAQEELPKDPEQPMEIEPPLLIQEAPNKNVVFTRPDLPGEKPVADPERVAASLEKAKKSAASGERLYKSGIIAKVDAENRVLKVVRLEADLAEAKLEAAKQVLASQQERVAAGEIPESDSTAAVAALASATREAEEAAARRERAELEAARLNLQRQQKLLAMGSGRKSEVNRAQEKVSALLQPKE
jgi:hypothetical protein